MIIDAATTFKHVRMQVATGDPELEALIRKVEGAL